MHRVRAKEFPDREKDATTTVLAEHGLQRETSRERAKIAGLETAVDEYLAAEL